MANGFCRDLSVFALVRIAWPSYRDGFSSAFARKPLPHYPTTHTQFCMHRERKVTKVVIEGVSIS